MARQSVATALEFIALFVKFFLKNQVFELHR